MTELEPVRGHRNKRVVEAARLHRARARRDSGLTLIEGPTLLEDAVSGGIIPLRVFALADDRASARICEAHQIDLVLVDEDAMGRLAGTVTPRGPISVVAIPESSIYDRTDARSVMVSWGVSDPGNMGTMIRTAAAFGWEFGYGPLSADPWSPKVIRGGAGGHFKTGLHPITEIDEMGRFGLETVATVVSGGVSPDSLPPSRYAVLVGPEPRGLDDGLADRCTHKVTIPMPGGTESLNAAIAAGIVIYALSTDATTRP